MALARFMSTTAGRALRIALGIALIAWGLAGGIPVLAVIGLVPLAAGLFNVCLIGPLLKAPFSGAALKRQ